MASPASVTRKDAMVTGVRYRSPTFAAIKFTAHTATTSPTAPDTAKRPGGRPEAFSMCTESGQPFFARGERFDAICARCETDTRPARHADGSLRGNRHFRLDDVFMPVAPAGGHVAWQNKIRQSGKRDVVRAPDSGFEHAAAPHRNAI